ncbi:MAG: hypothetical protein WCJ64_11635 [Rhodospirillaceae bacterium]
MRLLGPALALPALAVIALVAAASVRAGEPASPAQPTPREQTLQGLDLVMQGLKRMIEQVPLYGPPEMAPNGDIIIRRITPGSEAPPPALAPPAATPGAQRL